jgi:hypothetical protein
VAAAGVTDPADTVAAEAGTSGVDTVDADSVEAGDAEAGGAEPGAAEAGAAVGSLAAVAAVAGSAETATGNVPRVLFTTAGCAGRGGAWAQAASARTVRASSV